MALDSSIALQVKPLQIDNPLDVYGRAAQIKQAQQQNRLADLAYGEKMRATEYEGKRRNALTSAMNPETGEIDAPKYRNALASIGDYDGIQSFQKSQADQAKSAADALKQRIESSVKEIEFGAQLFSGVRDQASYDQARQEVARVLGPERAAQMPAQYDPVTLEANRMRALTVKDQLAEKWKALEFGHKQVEFGETVRHNKAAEGNQAGQLAVSQGQLGVARGNLAVSQGNLAVNQQRETREGSAPKDKPLTETQGKATAFAARAQQADKLIADLDYSSAAINSKASVENTPLVGGMLGAAVNNFALSATDQKAEQAQRDFINAILRQESGAAIGKDEFNNARKQYFPQPGDDAETLTQKAANRRLAIEGLKAQAGPGASKIDGMIDRSNIDLTKVKPGTPEYDVVMRRAEAQFSPELRNRGKTTQTASTSGAKFLGFE